MQINFFSSAPYLYWNIPIRKLSNFFLHKPYPSAFKAGPPLDLGFWSFLTFLHSGIEEVERHLLWKFHKKNSKGKFSGRLTSGSRPAQAVTSPFCQRSKDEGKLQPKFTKCEKINIFEHATGFRPPVAMAKPKWRQILLSLTLFSNVTSKEGKPMSCACSVFIPVKRMGVCNFSPMG